MRLLILSLFAIGSFTVNNSAHADPKWSSWGGWDLGFKSMNRANYDFSPYLDHPHHSHPVYNENRDWEPAHWISQFDGGAEEFIYRGYQANIIHEQDTRSDIPTLVVGPGFYMLSAYDQRRYLRTIDAIYGMSNTAPNIMLVRDWKSDNVVGAVDKKYITLQ